MNKLALYSPTPTATNTGMMLSFDHQKTRKISNYDGCRADYARNFNYVIISGNLQQHTATEKLKDLYDAVQGHFLFSHKLSIYFRLTSFDMSSVAHLLKVCKWVSFSRQKGEDVNVYWEAATNNVEVLELGEDFSEFCGFPFEIRRK